MESREVLMRCSPLLCMLTKHYTLSTHFARPGKVAVFEFTTELLRDGKVTDAAYECMVKMFGARGTIELGAIISYYIMIAMTLRAHEVPLPPGKAPPLHSECATVPWNGEAALRDSRKKKHHLVSAFIRRGCRHP